MMDSITVATKRPAALKTILTAGFIAGVLDASAASIQYMISSHGKSPVVVWKYVASGFFGKSAFAGGWTMVAYGLAFHSLNAMLFAAFFFFLYSTIRWIANNIIFAGLLYGIFVWCVMNLIVVPLSNVPPYTFRLSKAIIAALILIACVGIPIALVVHRVMRQKK